MLHSVSLIFKYNDRYLICNENRKIYYYRNNIRENYIIPLHHLIGGKIEKDEHPLEAALREFEEETGFKTSFYINRKDKPCPLKHIKYIDYSISDKLYHRFYVYNLNETTNFKLKDDIINFRYIKNGTINYIYWSTKKEIQKLDKNKKTSLLDIFVELLDKK